jgi:hypothetical protein
MADLMVVAVTPEITTYTAAALQTLLQVLAAAQQRLKVAEVSVSFKGTSNTASPVLVEVLSQSTAGTGGNALTLAKWDPDMQETIQSTALYGPWSTTEPTAGSVYLREEVHPQTGFLWQPTFGRELRVNGGGRIGIRINAPALVTVVARMVFEE